VILQIDLKSFFLDLSKDDGSNTDAGFAKALDEAQAAMANGGNFIDAFGTAYKKYSNGTKLADIFSRNESLRDEITNNASDADVLNLLRTKADEAVNQTFLRLRKRIDKLGVVQPNVSLDKSRNLIVVELPGMENPERARQYFTKIAKLEFWDTYRLNDPGIADAFVAADKKLKDMMGASKTIEAKLDSIREPKFDSLGNVVDSVWTVMERPSQDIGPLFSKLQLAVLQSGGLPASPIMGYANKNQRKAISDLLKKPEVKALFPPDVKFLWSYKPYDDKDGKNTYMLYAIKMPYGKNTAPLGGDHVTNAATSTNPTTNEIVVTLTMDNQGAKIWGDMTSKAFANGKREVAVALDDDVVSSPSVQSAILGGNTQISGNFSVADADELANILEVGKLPAKVRIIEEQLIGPSLGKENIQKSFNSVALAFVLLLLFMIAYYAFGGVVAVISLLANLFFIFGALASYGTVLTLPGIAGIVLTLGMAVDANVIIYERIREGLRAGKSMKAAISDGFKHSYSAIIDANVTSLLTAMVLSYFGLGPIKGFAVVLIIGILSSMLTALVLTKLIIDWWIEKGRNASFSYSWSANILTKTKVDWIGLRKYGYIFSSVLILVGATLFFTRGFDLGVDFTGGYSYNVQFDKNVNVDADVIRKQLKEQFGSEPTVKVVSTDNTFNIVTKYMIDSPEDNAIDVVTHKLFEGVNAIAGGQVNEKAFKDVSSKGTKIISSSKVGPTIADDIRKSSFESALVALLLIFIYLAIRFRKWQFSMGAVIALFHDVLATLSMFLILEHLMPFSMEINQAFVAAILTVIGYSVNDTVIVYDRIREFIDEHRGTTKKEVFNLAINRTLSRTLITSLTTLIVIVILLVFGGSSIKGFAFAIMWGIIFGTYSSIFIASASVVDLTPGWNPMAPKAAQSTYDKKKGVKKVSAK
ncbi:MAG TPA: protein translocase subunit SecD, partial [Saprospiraceae bacterium]|nr:protein translocase subunit SecD [Saprospiraceae bacterium]